MGYEKMLQIKVVVFKKLEKFYIKHFLIDDFFKSNFLKLSQ